MFGPSVTNGFRVAPKKIADIRSHAMHVRKVCSIEVDVPFFPMATFIESWTLFGITVDIVESDALPPGVEAACMPEKLLIQFTERTYQMACQDHPRGRFTAVHELGHLALSHTRSFHREAPSPGKKIQAYEDSEWQANTFAAEFLMPLADISKNDLGTVSQLMMRYQVSEAAASMRLRQLRKQKAIQ